MLLLMLRLDLCLSFATFLALVFFYGCRYDFAVYGLLAPEIGAAFFPQSSRKLQLISSFGVGLAAFLMR
jgi:hypothetical protein